MIFKGNLGEVLAENCIVRGKPFDLGGGGDGGDLVNPTKFFPVDK